MPRRSRLPKPPEPPDGFMLFYGRKVPIVQAEQYAKRMMFGFDELPPQTRFALNCVPVYPQSAAKQVRQFGDAGAANRIIKSNWARVFKTRDGTGARP